MSRLLHAQNLVMQFGGLRAVSDFSLELAEGELVGLIGPNGAGKTTVFNMLTGVYAPTSGTIRLQNATGTDENIAGLLPHKITRKGVARTFQNIRLFKSMSVWENVSIARHSHVPYNLAQGVLRLPPFRKAEIQLKAEILELLAIFKIDNKAEFQASNLPYGEQRKLEIVRALASKPRILLLDEPAAGMNPQETLELMELIRFIKERFQLTVLLIEHDMSLVMGICERLLVLDYGRTIASGLPLEIRQNPVVIKAYLGEDAVHA
ncbi:MAG: ABC transporter ATP-binding protein [Spirochaetales bacterium]